MAVFAARDANIPGYDKLAMNFLEYNDPHQYQYVQRQGRTSRELIVDVLPLVLQSDNVGPYRKECRNHHLRCNNMREDKAEFINEPCATKRWKAVVKKHFPDYKEDELPEMDFYNDENLSRSVVLSSEDLMTKLIIPKLEFEDGMNIHRWGKIMALSFLKPNENFAYRNYLLYYPRTYWFGWYRGRIEEKGKRVVFFCACETWDEYTKTGEQAYWLEACSDDEFEDNEYEREKHFRFKKYSTKFMPRPKLTKIKPKSGPERTYISADNESYVHLWAPLNFYQEEDQIEGTIP